jgi:hypothetical protein
MGFHLSRFEVTWLAIRPLVGFPGAALEAKRAVWRVWKIDWSWAFARRER